MSARANPYHNAWAESFMGILKYETLSGGCFAYFADAKPELFEDINGYYST